jgi:hypothetical protein
LMDQYCRAAWQFWRGVSASSWTIVRSRLR